MPYIEQDRRRMMTERFPGREATPGDLAYLITGDVLDWMDIQPKKRSFTTFAISIGVLVCCVLEIYRRLVVPYEDRKIAENGDVEGLKG